MKRLSLLIFLFIACITPSFAQQKSKAVRDLERQRKQALEAVQKTEKQLKNVQSTRTKKQELEKLLATKVKQQQQVVSILDKEIKTLDIEIDSLAVVALNLKNQEEQRKKAYERSVIALQQKKNNTDKFLFILSSKDFDQAMRRIRFVSDYASAHNKAARELNDTRKAIEATQNNIQSNKHNKSKLLVARERERKKLEAEKVATGKEVASLKGQEKNLQQQKKKYEQQAVALNRKIEQQIAWEIAEAERKARENNKKGTETRKAVTKGGYAMTAEERKLSGNFASNKGNLLIPVSGPYTIISHFGVQQHKQATKVQTNNSGIDISVPKGTKVRAVFEGTVTSIFVLSGYNNSIIVRHGNYLTVYANVINIQVKKGQRVKTGQTLGTVATNEGSTVLHFQLWYERTKQNPELWIR